MRLIIDIKFVLHFLSLFVVSIYMVLLFQHIVDSGVKHHSTNHLNQDYFYIYLFILSLLCSFLIII